MTSKPRVVNPCPRPQSEFMQNKDVAQVADQLVQLHDIYAHQYTRQLLQSESQQESVQQEFGLVAVQERNVSPMRNVIAGH